MSASERAGVIAFALVLSVCGCGDGTRPASAEPTISMADPREKHYGLGYADWAVAYMKWQFETSFSVLLDIKDCVAGQDVDHDGELGPVIFLDRDLALRTAPRACEFSSEKAILFPLLSVGSLTPYYTDRVITEATLHVDASQAPAKDLEDSVSKFMARLVIDEVSIRVDGRELRDALSGRIAPTKYSYEPYPGDNFLFRFYGAEEDTIPGVVEDAFVAGYWIMLKPLGPGAHELSVIVRGHTGGEDLQVFKEQFTYQLTLD
jgi:hypothetical protein